MFIGYEKGLSNLSDVYVVVCKVAVDVEARKKGCAEA